MADLYSKSGDGDDWGIKLSVFKYFDNTWGPFSVDRFASTYNAKCEIFNSRWWCPGTAGIDGLLQVWGGVNNWLVSPPRLVPKVINKMLDERVRGTLIVPYWPSAPFWPVLAPLGGTFASFIQENKMLPASVVIKGKGENGFFEKGEGFRMVALKIKC